MSTQTNTMKVQEDKNKEYVTAKRFISYFHFMAAESQALFE